MELDVDLAVSFAGWNKTSPKLPIQNDSHYASFKSASHQFEFSSNIA